MAEHSLELRRGDDGWYYGVCELCGWESPPSLFVDVVADAYDEHRGETRHVAG